MEFKSQRVHPCNFGSNCMNYVPINNDKEFSLLKIYPIPCVIKHLDFYQSQRYLITFIGFSLLICEIWHIFIFRNFLHFFLCELPMSFSYNWLRKLIFLFVSLMTFRHTYIWDVLPIFSSLLFLFLLYFCHEKYCYICVI